MTEKMIDRVIKLLNKAESTTPEEAENLVAKAQEIMTRHAIDEAMLAAARGEQAPDTIKSHTITFTGIYATSHQELAFAVGRGNDFYLIQGGYGNRRTATWVGFESEIRAAETVLASLLIQATRFQKEFMKDWNADHSWASAFEKASARRSFLNGFAWGIQERLVKARRDAEKAAEKDYSEAAAAVKPDEQTEAPKSTSVALVLAGKKERINDWVDSHYGKLRNGRSAGSTKNWSAAGAGRSAAGRADLGGGKIGGGSKGALGR